MKSRTLNRVLAVLLVFIAITLVGTHFGEVQSVGDTGTWQVIAGVAAGLVIGVVAALMGVAGGELLIPTIVLFYAIDIKVAGSLSLAVSLPTMLVAFARYSRDQSFQVLAANKGFLVAMAAGSVAGTIIGALLLGAVSATVLIPVLAAILVLSSFKMAARLGLHNGRECPGNTRRVCSFSRGGLRRLATNVRGLGEAPGSFPATRPTCRVQGSPASSGYCVPVASR